MVTQILCHANPEANDSPATLGRIGASQVHGHELWGIIGARYTLFLIADVPRMSVDPPTSSVPEQPIGPAQPFRTNTTQGRDHPHSARVDHPTSGCRLRR